MNNKGFTLIELLVTIALLAVISIISFVSINAVIEKSRVNECNNLVSSIKSAAKEYVSDNRYDTDVISTGTYEYTINANTLITKNYLTGPIVNPFTKVEVKNPQNIQISIKLSSSNYTVKEVKVKGISTETSFLNDCNKKV